MMPQFSESGANSCYAQGRVDKSAPSQLDCYGTASQMQAHVVHRVGLTIRTIMAELLWHSEPDASSCCAQGRVDNLHCDSHSRALKKNTSHGNEVLPQDTTHLIQRPCYR